MKFKEIKEDNRPHATADYITKVVAGKITPGLDPDGEEFEDQAYLYHTSQLGRQNLLSKGGNWRAYYDAIKWWYKNMNESVEEDSVNEGMFEPAEYKGWKYTYDVEEYDDNRKIFHSAIKDGKEVSMDWSPYSKPTDEEFKLWVDLGMPTREDVDSRGPLDKDDLLSLADKSGLKGLLKNSDRELDEIKHLSGILQDDLHNYNKEDPYNSTFSPKVGIGSMTLRGWKNTMVDRVEDLLSRLNRAKDNLDQDILWQGIHKILKGYNLDIIAQEIELAHEVLEKERSKGGIRSKAFTKDKTFEETKKDACYHKVKSRYKIWPSAYASGALVKCRKVGAKNWGNKSK